MAKKDENILGLPPPLSNPGLGSSATLATWNSHRAITISELRLLDEASLQKLAMVMIEEKTLLGMSQMAGLEQHASTTFDETVGFLMEVRDRAGRGKEHQAYLDEFTQRMVQMAAKHMLGAVEVGATGIAKEIDRSPYPAPPPHRSLLERLIRRE